MREPALLTLLGIAARIVLRCRCMRLFGCLEVLGYWYYRRWPRARRKEIYLSHRLLSAMRTVWMRR